LNSEKLALLVALGIFLCILWTNAAFAQLSTKPSIEITSHATGQEVSVGELTISGRSADNVNTDCQVEVDWNNQKPYQKTLANGPGGINDYSNWTFTYTNNYHLITNGTNELTARLSCTDNSIPMAWDTVELLGTSGGGGGAGISSIIISSSSSGGGGCINSNDKIGISRLVNATTTTTMNAINIASNATTTTTNVILPSLVYNFEQSPKLSGSDCIDVANNSSLQLAMFSIASWFNTGMNVSNGSNTFIITKGGMGSDMIGNNMNYGIWMTDSGNIETGFENSSGANYFVTSPLNYNDSKWHYAVGTYDGSAVKLYIDGVQVADNSTIAAATAPALAGGSINSSIIPLLPDNTGTQPVRIGANSLRLDDDNDGKGTAATTTAGYYIGSIGEIRAWNRSLSAEEVAVAYNNGLFNTTGQVLYLPFSSQNHLPVADAGPDFTINEKGLILLNAAKGSDPDPMDTLMYKWTQIGGSPFVILSNNNTATPIFNAPLDIPADTTFTLQFSVIDNHGLIGTDTLNVLVKNIPPPPIAPPAELEEEEDEEDAAAADEEEEEEEEEEDAAAADEEEDDTGFPGFPGLT
jgi:hypothetical protein